MLLGVDRISSSPEPMDFFNDGYYFDPSRVNQRSSSPPQSQALMAVTEAGFRHTPSSDLTDELSFDVSDSLHASKMRRMEFKRDLSKPAMTERSARACSKFTALKSWSRVSTFSSSTERSIGNDRPTSVISTSSEESAYLDSCESLPRLQPSYSARPPSRRADPSDDSDSESEDDDEDAISNEELESWLRSHTGKHIAFGDHRNTARTLPGAEPRRRNLPVEQPYHTMEAYTHNGFALSSGVDVEYEGMDIFEDRSIDKAGDERGYDPTSKRSSNDFMRIVEIIRDARDQAVSLRGWIFRRASYLNGIVEKKRNEVCWVMDVDEDDERGVTVQAMETIPVGAVVRCRKIRLTNQPWPRLSFREDEAVLVDSEETIRNEQVLVCRYKYVCYYACAQRREMNCWIERCLERLRPSECDKPDDTDDCLCVLDDEELRCEWRGHSVSGVSVPSSAKAQCIPAKRRAKIDTLAGPQQGSCYLLPVECPPKIISLFEQLRRKSSAANEMLQQPAPRLGEIRIGRGHASNAGRLDGPPWKHQYTFCDAFCGAGGMSRAAYQVGLRIKYAFDCNKHACATYGLNFPRTRVYCLWAHEFIQQVTGCKVDIMHLSPPCQPFSDAHTHVGKDDEMNTAALFAVGELLRKSRPRVVTLEQTYGIVLRAKHQGYLNALIQMFTTVGFSVRWRLLHCEDYGLPQIRFRTFIIASCPGEPLPAFPPPTHTSSPSASSTLLPHTTITSTLEAIPPSAPNHDVWAPKARKFSPYSGSELARTITCDGGGMVHPNGTRDFTIREFAALQGFPSEHVFGKIGAKAQIGNAVPPIVGRALLESVVKALQKEDGIN